jgi:predicted transcriptional regulator
MKNNKIHRVIVEDTKNSVFTGFITYETIFEYFITNYYSDMVSFHLKIDSLNIKSKNLITVKKEETIFNCLLMLWNRKISFLPIVNNDDTYFGFLFLKDIVYFFTNGEKFTVK